MTMDDRPLTIPEGRFAIVYRPWSMVNTEYL